MDEEKFESLYGSLNELKRLVEAAGLEGMDSHAYECDTYVFRDAGGELHECWPAGTDGRVNVVFALTPEQAVEATIGRGECTNAGRYIDGTRFECSRCGWNGWVRHASDGRDHLPKSCPNCGRKVVDE